MKTRRAEQNIREHSITCAVNKLELLCRVLESRKRANKSFALPIDYKLMQILRFEWVFEAPLLRFF